MVLCVVIIIFLGLISYLLGSINLSIIISKLMGKGDIRDFGSKNAGTTNTLRVLGKGPALLVFIWDVLKGALAIGLVRGVMGLLLEDKSLFNAGENSLNFNMIYSISMFLSSLCVILGHNYPAFFGFKGGKGVATSLGVIFAIEWRIGLVCLAVVIVGISIFQFVSVGSLIAAIEYPILVIIMGGQFDVRLGSSPSPSPSQFTIKIMYIIFSFVLATMVIFKHKTNIERIKNGTENKLRFKKTAEEKIAEEKAKMEAVNAKEDK